jgi:hypothetical protein
MIIRSTQERSLLQFHVIHHLDMEASVSLTYITSNIWNKCLFQFVHINTVCTLIRGREDAPCTFLTVLDPAGIRLLASRSCHLYYPIRKSHQSSFEICNAKTVFTQSWRMRELSCFFTLVFSGTIMNYKTRCQLRNIRVCRHFTLFILEEMKEFCEIANSAYYLLYFLFLSYGQRNIWAEEGWINLEFRAWQRGSRDFCRLLVSL